MAPDAPSPAAKTPTRERLLDAAEKQFAEHGIAAASLRRITSDAGANLAAVHYHFGSKDGLVEAVFERRLTPLNAERMARLDAAVAAAPGGLPELTEILDAFLAPALKLGLQDGREFFVMIARAHAMPDPTVQRLITECFREVAGRFVTVFSRRLPGLGLEELMWRLHFIVGSLCHVVVNTHLLTIISQGLCAADDEDAVCRRLVEFAAAGLTASAHGGRPS